MLYVCGDGIDQETYFPRRELLLAGEGVCRVGSNARGVTRGPIDGNALVLWEDGTLGRLTYTGSWTHWQREPERIQTACEVVTSRAALDEYDLESCLETIAAALTTAATNLGDVHTRANTLRRRSEALHRAAEALRAP